MDNPIELEAIAHAAQILDKWTAIIGIGFHPDTRGADYSPELTPDLIAEYDRDMDKFFQISADPYEDALAACERAGFMSPPEGER